MAKPKFYLESDNSIRLASLRNANTGDYINDATVKLSVFHQDSYMNLDHSALAFTGGGTYEIKAGDVIEGATSTATAYVDSVTVDSGSWSAGDAAGTLYISKQVGNFEPTGETLIVDSGEDVATIPGDSSGAESANAGTKTKLPISNHGLTVEDCIRIEGSYNYDAEHYPVVSVPDKDHVIIVKTYQAEKFKGSERVFVGLRNGVNLTMSYIDTSNGDYRALVPDTVRAVLEENYVMLVAVAVKDSSKKTVKVRWKAVFDEGTD